MQDEMPPHNCGPNNESLAKADRSESASDEDDEDLNDYELGMMVDDDLSHSEKADTTEGSSNINDIENVILDLNGSELNIRYIHKFEPQFKG
jgi:arginyl-tRNA---protein transferase